MQIMIKRENTFTAFSGLTGRARTSKKPYAHNANVKQQIIRTD